MRITPERVAERLQEHRVVVLVGPGGVGKTTLARSALAVFDAETKLEIGCGAAPDSDEVWAILARELGLAVQATSRLCEALSERPAPVILIDEVEHLGSAVHAAVDQLAQVCPVLVTSRTWIQESHHHLEVGALEVPTEAAGCEVTESGRVLVEAVRVVQPEWQLDEASRAAFFSLLQRLDGLPLALQLAGRRMARCGVHVLNDMLESGVGVLSARHETGRHRSLGAALRASWEPLTAGERALMVFASHLTGRIDPVFRDALVHQACQGAQDPAALVTRLEESCWFQSMPKGHRILRPVRMFVLEQVDASARESLQHRFDHWVVEQVESLCSGRGYDPGALDALQQLRPDVLAAHDRALEGEPKWALRAGRAAHDVLTRLGPARAREPRIERTLRHTRVSDDPELWAWTVSGWGQGLAREAKVARLDEAIAEVAALGGDVGKLQLARMRCVVEGNAEAVDVVERTWPRLSKVDDRLECLRSWSTTLAAMERFDEAVVRAREGIALAERAGRRDHVAMLQVASGYARVESGDWEGSEDLVRAVESTWLHPTFECIARRHLSLVHELKGELPGAWEQAHASLRAANRIDSHFKGVCRARIAGLHALSGDLETATALLSRATRELSERLFGIRALVSLQAARVFAAGGHHERAKAELAAIERHEKLAPEMRGMLELSAAFVETQFTVGSVTALETLTRWGLRPRRPDEEVVWRALGAQRSRMHAGPVLIVHESGALQLDEDPLVLHGANRRIAEHLARSVGTFFDQEALVEVGWPDSELYGNSARVRLHTTLSLLRKAGLRPFIERGEGGWRIDPTQPVVTGASSRSDH